MTSETASHYFAVRERVADAVRAASPDRLAATVPACPDWSAHDLVAHLESLPTAILAGNVPSGDPNEWIQGLVDERSERSAEDLLSAWHADDEALAGLLENARLLLGDLLVHEGDLAGALGSDTHRNAPEYVALMQATLGGLGKELRDTDLGAIQVRSGDQSWTSHDAPVGWTMLVDPWEGFRAANSRRTADELRAIPHEGDPEPFIATLHDHLPLPTSSLGE